MAHVVDLTMEVETYLDDSGELKTKYAEYQLLGDKAIPIRYLHSNAKLSKNSYQFAGSITAEEFHSVKGFKTLGEFEAVVSIDAFAYRQRHQSRPEIVRIRTGNYVRPSDGQVCQNKLVGITNMAGQLFLLVGNASERVKDIQPLAPVRVAGIYGALRALNLHANVE